MSALGTWIKRLVQIAIAIAIAWVGGLVWFAETMPREASRSDAHTDAIVVLTGGADRIAEGARLLAQGRAKWLFISGVNPGVKKAELMRVIGVTEPALKENIVIGQFADTTRENAAETAAWMKSRNFRSLRLVTANYHMRRSLLEFRRLMPEAEIVPHPVFPSPVTPGPWWRDTRALSIVTGEYNKYLAAFAGLAP